MDPSNSFRVWRWEAVRLCGVLNSHSSKPARVKPQFSLDKFVADTPSVYTNGFPTAPSATELWRKEDPTSSRRKSPSQPSQLPHTACSRVGEGEDGKAAQAYRRLVFACRCPNGFFPCLSHCNLFLRIFFFCSLSLGTQCNASNKFATSMIFFLLFPFFSQYRVPFFLPPPLLLLLRRPSPLQAIPLGNLS